MPFYPDDNKVYCFIKGCKDSKKMQVMVLMAFYKVTWQDC